MDESKYRDLAEVAFRRIEDALKDVDPDVVECERTQGDVLTLTFSGRRRCVINTQRPTQQIWVAANARAWHFSFDEASGAWSEAKSGSSELFATLQAIVKESASLELSI